MNPFKLERYFAEYEFSAKFLLSSSDCQPLALNELVDMADPEAKALWDTLSLAYTESLGLPLLREEIVKSYTGVDPNEILVAGPQEGIFLAMNTLLEPDDEVVVTFPGYQSLYEIAETKGCKVKYWQPDINHQFMVEDLKNMLSPKTKLLVINFPHNPTGAIITASEQQEIIDLCRKNNCMIFSDEMYRNLEFDPTDRIPSISEVYENSITLCGMSKSYSLPGLRLGWLVVKDERLLLQIQKMKDYTSICPPAPSEILSLIALRNSKSIFENNLQIIKTNLAHFEHFLVGREEIIRWIPPKAGSIAFPELLLQKDIEKFCRCLVDKTGVMLLPGSVYNYPGRYFRIGLGRTNFPIALAAFARFLKN